MSLTRSQILAAPSPPPVAVPVPEWGGDVLVRVMSGLERERFEKLYVDTDRADLRATLLACTLADDEGNLLFTPDDIPAINRHPAPILMRLYDVALEVNRVTRAQVEELAGN